MGTPTELFDPFAGLNLARTLRGKLPDEPGRFAPLLGMVLAELEQTGHALDFLNPRRRPQPPSRRKKLAVVGAAAVLLAAGSLFGSRAWERSRLNEQISELNNELAPNAKLAKDVTAAEEAVKAVDAIKKWTDTDVVWLDELYGLSRDFPPAIDAMLVDLTLGPGQRGGKMTLEGLAADVDSIQHVEDGLRSESRRVDDAGSSEDNSTKPYTRRTTWMVFVEREKQ